MHMAKRRKVPIRIGSTPTWKQAASTHGEQVVEAVPPVTEQEQITSSGVIEEQVEAEPQPAEGGVEEWRGRALRLQAEMENFRKRQRRIAEDQILAERERILRELLSVVDDLDRALQADKTDVESLRQGVALTRQSMLRLLKREGVEPLRAKAEPFDPRWHEAVGAVPHENVGAPPNTVVQVVRQGYRLRDRLLRPARVIITS
jgi:molecular chaperone GrpE